MKKKFFLWPMTLLAMLMIGGCASPVYEEKYAWTEGWREGRVNRLTLGEEAVRKYRASCSEARVESTDRFAVVEWKQHERRRWFTARLPKDANATVGDEVFVNILNCQEPVISRTILQSRHSSN